MSTAPSPESRGAIARFQLQMTLDALDPLDQALASVPDDRLGEQPVPEQMPVGQMIGHAYRAAAMCARAARLGRMEEADMEGLGDPEGAETRADLEAMGMTAREELTATMEAMTPEAADRMIEFFFGISATGLQSTSIGYSETLHHRGQVISFLRLMGLEPPNIYEGQM